MRGERLRVSVTFNTYNSTRGGISTRSRPPGTHLSPLMTFLSPFADGEVIFMPDMFLGVSGEGVVKIDLNIPDDVVSGFIEVTWCYLDTLAEVNDVVW